MHTAGQTRSKAVPRGRAKPADPAEALKPLEGMWYGAGAVYPSAYGPGREWRSHEHTEWLWGKRFLLHHWRAHLDDAPFEGLTVYGQDEHGGYFAQQYDNQGTAVRYQVDIAAGHWRLKGEAQRAEYAFAPDGRTIDITWEWRDGRSWKPLCERRATRAQNGGF